MLSISSRPGQSGPKREDPGAPQGSAHRIEPNYMRIVRAHIPGPACVAYVPDRLLVIDSDVTHEDALVIAERITGKPAFCLAALLDVAFNDDVPCRLVSAFGRTPARPLVPEVALP